MQRPTPFRSPESGAVIVEFSIVLGLVLLLFTCGVLDFGRAFNEHAIMVDAARIGARSASVYVPNGGTPADTALDLARAAVQRHLTEANFNPANYQINVRSTTLALDQTGTVSVPAIEVNVSRTKTDRFAFLSQLAFKSCVRSVFRLDGGIDVSTSGAMTTVYQVTVDVEDPNC